MKHGLEKKRAAKKAVAVAVEPVPTIEFSRTADDPGSDARGAEEVLLALALAVEQRDNVTAGHCERLALTSLDYVPYRSTTLPWKSPLSTKNSDAQAANAAGVNGGELSQPGVWLFRKASEENAAKPDLELVFLIGESPTTGISKPQFQNAVNQYTELFGEANREVHVIIESEPAASPQEYHDFLDRTAGAWQGEFERPPQGQPEERDSM